MAGRRNTSGPGSDRGDRSVGPPIYWDGPHPRRDTLSSYVDGELDPVERLEVHRHVNSCATCRATVAEYRNASDLFQRVPTVRPPMELNRAVWRKVSAADEEHRRRRILPFGLPLPSANALGLVVTALLVVMMLPQLVGVWTAATTLGTRRAERPQTAAQPVVETPLATLAIAATPAAAATVEPAPTVAPTTAPPSPQATVKIELPPASTAASGPASAAGQPAAGGQAPAGAATPTRPAQTVAPVSAPIPATATAAVQLREVSGQVQAVDRRQRSMTVVAPASGGAPARTWQLSVGEATAFTNKDGGKLTFEDVGLADQVEVKGFEQAPAAGALQVAQLRVVVSAVAQAAAAKASRVLVLLDGATNLRTPQYGFTGDWIKRLHDTGYAVTPQEPASISANTNLRDFNLIVIGYPATLSDAAIQAVTSSKVPVLNAEPRLVQRLGLGLNVDPQQPIHMVAGKQVEVAGGANPVTKGFAGETAVANDTLYRTPIVASGTVLGTILDGGRRQAVWSVTGSTMYFGFWWSNTGQNHNATYWTLFDRSVLLLLGKDPLAPPTAR